MAKKVNMGSTKRYGPRYGRRNKDKVANIEKEHRGKHKCPYCNYVKVVRLSKGIWHCLKCDVKFAGKAYTYELPKKGYKPRKTNTKVKELFEKEDELYLEEEEQETTPVEEQENVKESSPAEVA